MKTSDPTLTPAAPKSVLLKPITFDAGAVFASAAKGIGHAVTGQWAELGADAADALSGLGLTTDASELAYLLIQRSLTQALFDLVGDNVTHLTDDARRSAATLVKNEAFSLHVESVTVDRRFFERPAELALVVGFKSILQRWLESVGLPRHTASAISERFPSYFVYALNQEWRRSGKEYAALREAVETPFTRASEREFGWVAYSAMLVRNTRDCIFDEPFSLSQLFVPLNAYYTETPAPASSIDDRSREAASPRKIVVALKEELETWISSATREDAIRVISGGPGSGKSAFSRMFAASIAERCHPRVLFVPLHLIDPSRDLVEEVGRFVKDEGILPHNPLSPETPEPSLLVIFDGLDELASQGKSAADTARAFVREVEKTVDRRNSHQVRLRVLLSGRELVVQDNESEFRGARQVLTLLPYYVPGRQPTTRQPRRDGDDYIDPKNLLQDDLRHHWWRNYGALTGRNYDGLPHELRRADLDEITAQPLLNYLVALSYTREKLDFTKDVNLNQIYGDLVTAVHERGYEKRRVYVPIRHMRSVDFVRVLEEVGLAAWHGDGRTTTVREIEEHCRIGGVGGLLDAFKEGATAGVTRLLAAFFFRQYGHRPSGDPTFVFTHKSFGEYLAALRVVRALQRITKELESRAANPDEGWDVRDALKHWAQVCGPSPVSRYIYGFLANEILLRPPADAARYQERLATLFGHVLQHGMPMEQIPLPSFTVSALHARNAEEALLAALCASANAAKRVSAIATARSTDFGSWFRRIQGQRTGSASVLAAACLSYLDLSESHLDIGDFYGADCRHMRFEHGHAYYSTFRHSNLTAADLSGAIFRGASLDSAILADARMDRAMFDDADLKRALLEGASLERASLERADLREAQLQRANLRGAELEGADLRRADLTGADLTEARLEDADLRYAKLKGTRLAGAHLAGAQLDHADIDQDSLRGASFERRKELRGTPHRARVPE